MTTIFRKMWSMLLALAVAMVGMFAFTTITSSTVVTYASAGTTATENITEMIEDLVPSFVLLIFVMVFMLMLLTIVDRVGKH